MTTELDGPTPTAQELLAPELGSSQVRDNINYAVQRLIIQCGALLRQQIERAGPAGNRAVSEAEVDQIMFQFQAASAELESTISTEVAAFALERIGQVLEHALNDSRDALTERVLRSSQRDDASPQSAPAIATEPHEPAPALAVAGPGAPVIEANSDVERRHHDDGAASEPQHSDQHAVEPNVETDGEIFQGAVGLTIDSHGDTGGIVDFINQLRQEHGVLLTQLTGGGNSISRLTLRLPAPIAFRDALRRMRGVSDVFDSRDSDLAGGRPTFMVQLFARES